MRPIEEIKAHALAWWRTGTEINTDNVSTLDGREVAELCDEIERLKTDLAANARMLAKQCDLAREAETEVKRLRAIVDKLPTTADGVRVVCDEVERLRKAVTIAGLSMDGFGDRDLHLLALDVYMERTGDQVLDAAEPTGEDYGEAFVRAVEAASKAD